MAIDYGSSFTCAAISADGRVSEILEIDNSRYLPSVVCLDEDGHLVTGRDAAQEAAIHPGRAERQPKRALVAEAEIRLGDRDISTVEITAATLRRVAEEATRRFGRPAERVSLTHPAGWTVAETGRLAAAAALAGLPEPVFVPEPVAAAIHYTTGGAQVPVGAHIAVYDLGGGTFDTAVLRRTAGGFEICGPPGGDPGFGGADVSEALREVVGAQLRDEAAAEWDRLWSDTSVRGRQRRVSQLDYLTQAKESLSARTTVTVPVHAADAQVRITRAELETAIEERLRPTVDELIRTIEAAGRTVEDIAAIYLTGGSSRIPLVSSLIAERTGKLPVAEGDPKAVVCLGALASIMAAPSPARLTRIPVELMEESPPIEQAPPVEPLPRPGWQSRPRVVIVAAAVVALVVAATATAYAAIAGSDDNGSTTATITTPPVITTTRSPEPGPSSRPGRLIVIPTSSPPTTRPTTPSARDVLSPAQQDLYDKLDLSDLRGSTCEEYVSRAAGAEASVQCSGKPAMGRKIAVIQFSSTSAMTAYFDGLGTQVDGDGQGDCLEGGEYLGYWNHNGERAGPMVCWTGLLEGENYFKIAWGFDDKLIAALLLDESASVAADWWRQHSTVVDP
ncbi:Hsp70 family protein [Paractinoplanes durhamensis]|uniref:Hsp70 family protein n=2 Tax=Paractinoplanes durhamensis TaxID=113563 RepID=A0ABQ3Z4K1_9ACTN|nr:hypothetical protein Adu01nite_60850 [Actinoplanes durhamensis]